VTRDERIFLIAKGLRSAVVHCDGPKAEQMTIRVAKIGVLTLLLLAAAPASSWAGWLGLRNDLKAAVVVRSSVVTNRGVVPGRPKALVAGEVAWEAVLLPGNRFIQIYDANNTLIYKKSIPIVGDQFFSIQMDAKNGVQLVPLKANVQPPGQKPK
jgi:hypothetical protein